MENQKCRTKKFSINTISKRKRNVANLADYNLLNAEKLNVKLVKLDTFSLGQYSILVLN